jgi:hypothetical protein
MEMPEQAQAIYATQCPPVSILSICHPERLYVRDLLSAMPPKKQIPHPIKPGSG